MDAITSSSSSALSPGFRGLMGDAPRSVERNTQASSEVTSSSISPSNQADSAPTTDELTQLAQSVQMANAVVATTQSSLEFSVDNKSGDVTVKVIDKETKEVIRQIPSKEMQALAKTAESLKGWLVQHKI